MTASESFIPGGYEAFPSLVSDSKRVGLLGDMRRNREGKLEYVYSTERIEELVMQYGHYLANNPMPRGKATAERILDHLLFELAYRDGVYDEILNEDELCEEA